jgi:hypothetical protein
MTQIFLSYSKQNTTAAQLLATKLERDGFSVWWDHELAAGEEYDITIESQLKSADKVVVLWSRASVISRWVRSEADHAAQESKLVPVLIEQVDIPVAFRLFHFVPMLSLGREIFDDEEYVNLLKAMRVNEIDVMAIQGLRSSAPRVETTKGSSAMNIGFAIVVFVVVCAAVALLANVWRQVL